MKSGVHELPISDEEVIAKRRRVVQALHAMHVDVRIRVDTDLARELDAAWDAYDAAVEDRALESRDAG